MKSKIDDLIAGEVQNGKLTSDQAEELKNVFAKVFSHGGGPQGGPGGPGGRVDKVVQTGPVRREDRIMRVGRPPRRISSTRS